MASIFDPLKQSVAALGVMADTQASEGSLAHWQQCRLVKLLVAASRNSKIYAERLEGIALKDAKLSTLPVVPKAELLARFDEWVADPELKLVKLREFADDPTRIAEPYLGKYLVWESSGSSNQSCIFVQDAQALAVYDALEAFRRCTPRPWQGLFFSGLLAERIAFIGATGGHFASTVSLQRLRQLNPLMARTLRCFSILQPAADLLRQLNEFAPTVIATYPTVAAWLADEAGYGRLRFLPKEVWTGGETLTSAARLRIEQTLACAVRNTYGASEFMSIGWECRMGKMHANTDWVILEPVDERGWPVPVGQPSYTTLLTNLANHVQPLIRYDLGDQLTWISGGCECGSSLPVIEVQGRRDDVLVMAGSHQQAVTLLPLALTTLIEDEAGVFDFQLCQRDAHTLVLKLDLPVVEAQAAMMRCRKVLTAYAHGQGLANIKLILERGPVLPRGRSGKAKKVVSATTLAHRSALDGPDVTTGTPVEPGPAR